MIHDMLRKRLLSRAGVFSEKERKSFTLEDLEELERSQWSPEFERLMKNRLVMGSLRYGKHNCPGKPNYDRIGSISRRLNEYREDGNLEHLVDAANECLCEFVDEVHPHPKRNFNSIDDGKHTEIH